MEPKITDWRGCYEGGWNGLVVPEAFQHPAKFSYALVMRIVGHGLIQGYWRPGDLIGDPFGGVALGGIACGYRELNWIGVELESEKNDPPGSPFVEIGNRNIDLHRDRWSRIGQPVDVRLVQGDSRRFAEVVGQVAGVVSSPPYADSFNTEADNPNKETLSESARKRLSKSDLADRNYGSTPGQIGSLKAGSLDGVVTSPPFEAQMNQGGADKTQIYRKWCEQNGRNPDAANAQTQNASKQWGESPDQVGNMSGETYWQAMHAVYSQMFAAMKNGGIAAIVVKDYVSKRARVPLCDQTCTLLESLGFEVFERCRCWLVKETREPSLFGGEHVTTTERKSFFRRLAEKKGSPRIDWEETLWTRRT